MNSDAVMRPMTVDDIPAVLALERAACPHPSHAWSEDSYRSSMASGYWMRVCCRPDGTVAGVCVAMFGVDELHLLNIVVALDQQGRGTARWMLGLLRDLCRAHQLGAIWLEVRPSNTRARALYTRQGYVEVSVRKGYYPAEQGREDALVMKQEVDGDGSLV